MNKKNPAGFTLIEVLVALAILGFVLSASLKIFSSNAQVVSALEKRTLASFVAENVLVQTYTFKNELMGADIGFGSKNKFQINFHFLKSRDNISSVVSKVDNSIIHMTVTKNPET